MRAPDEGWIVIPRWDEFQHRDAARAHVPTWVKTFTRLLSDDAYLTLTGNRRAILHGLWLEYARSLRELPGNTAVLSRRLSLKVTRRDLEALNHAGFIELYASNPASTHASQPAGIEQKREEQEPKAVTELHYDEDEPDLHHQPPATTNGRPQELTHIQNLIEHTLTTTNGRPQELTHIQNLIEHTLTTTKGAAA